MATVELVVNKKWSDSSGYQMLLDATATTYGDVIPADSYRFSEGDSTQEVYNRFQYKIPTDAGWTLDTDKVILYGESASIEIPAGVYDYCILNPTSDNGAAENIMWIADDKDGGNGSSKANNFRFRAGYTYTFTINSYKDDQYDGVDLVITGEGVPETGDAANTTLWALLMLTAAAAVCVLCRKKAIRERE